MNRLNRTFEAFARVSLVAFLVLLLSATSTLAGDLTFEQQEAIRKDFGNWEKTYKMTTQVLQELMGDEHTEKILADYADDLLMINIALELSRTGDLQAAAKLFLSKARDDAFAKIIKEHMPTYHMWMGWMDWAKTGMELFKDLVFDPMVESSQIETYIGLREAGLEPEDAFAGVRGYGNLVEYAKKEFRRQYGDLPFQQGSDALLPAWEEKFLRFAKANMENKYLQKLHEEATARLQAEAAEAQARLPEMREKLLRFLRQKQVKQLKIEPAHSELHAGEEVVLSAVAIYADPSALRSAEEVTAHCTWHGSPGDNVFTARKADIGRTITITADYYGIIGTATVTVVGADCGEHGRWDSNTERCDCESGYLYNEDLGECVRKDPDEAEGAAKERLRDMEHRFYAAVQKFDEHFENFVAGLKAHAGSSMENICMDSNLAFSFARAAAAYDIVESYYVDALDLVGRGERGLNWEAVAAGNYEPDIHVLDQIRLEMFRKEYRKVSEKGESLPTLLAELAPGCDPQDMLDLGARTAETDQNAETGIDGGDVAWSGDGGGSGGGGDGGGLRFARGGTMFTQIDKQAYCSGGAMTLNVSTPAFPDVIRPGDVVNIPVTFSWSVTGSHIEDSSVLAVAIFGTETIESQEFAAFSGSRTENFTFMATQSLFLQPAISIAVTVSGGILCDGGSSDGASSQYIQMYYRAGSN